MAVTELATFLIGSLILAGCVWAGFLAGRDSAERAAAKTVADLRRANLALRQQRDRAVENNARLARALRLTDPLPPETPEWMR